MGPAIHHSSALLYLLQKQGKRVEFLDRLKIIVLDTKTRREPYLCNLPFRIRHCFQTSLVCGARSSVNSYSHPLQAMFSAAKVEAIPVSGDLRSYSFICKIQSVSCYVVP
jgi:hypothetical protein